MKALTVVFILFTGLVCRASTDLNALVLEQLRSMPEGGRYFVGHFALNRLQMAISIEEGSRLRLEPKLAQPSFCSGATYLVLLKTLEQLHAKGLLTLDVQTLAQLKVQGQRDGLGFWGRWNANGPGTARLFKELELGRNFEDFGKALPGDFMKIFWTDEIGKLERGHSVIYLGTQKQNGAELVRFWSSNQPGGYGEKTVPRSKIARAIFSRLEAPQNLGRINNLPQVDRFLAEMLTRRCTMDEVRQKCGMQNQL